MRSTRDPAVVAAIVGAAADLLCTVARAWEGRGGGPLTDAADYFDRAAYEVRARVPARPVPAAGRLHALSRMIATIGAAFRNRDTVIMLDLIRVLAGLADALADLREAQSRLHQARCAREAASRIRGSASFLVEDGGRFDRSGRSGESRRVSADPVQVDWRRGWHRRR
jgi:hypothetical protein